MPGIPPALESDTEDVTWALQTAEALWKRNERSDALVWLRRAAQAAGEAEHDGRALALAHDAAELAEWIAGQPPILPRPPASVPRPPEPRITEPDEIEEVSVEMAVESDPSLPRDRMDTPTLTGEEAELPAVALAVPMPSSRALDRVPSAAEKHAGMLDPWADGESAASPPESKPDPPAAALRSTLPADADDVVTSAPPVRLPPASADAPPSVDLSGVDALSDLPDDARDAFARAAATRDLAQGDEISGFALALVLQGSVYVAATFVDTPAERLDAGDVLRARGTIEHVTPVRLVAATERARLAMWDEQAVERAFRTCPWVEDDLRAAADRFQALVGVTIGPLGERLDPELRAQVASRLKVRALGEHEVFASRGEPIPGLLVVGTGELELVDDGGAPAGKVLRAGDFLFPNEVLLAAPAPSTVRAAKGGALVLFAERHAAQELLVTCPPLLEIFASA